MPSPEKLSAPRLLLASGPWPAMKGGPSGPSLTFPWATKETGNVEVNNAERNREGTDEGLVLDEPHSAALMRRWYRAMRPRTVSTTKTREKMDSLRTTWARWRCRRCIEDEPGLARVGESIESVGYRGRSLRCDVGSGGSSDLWVDEAVC